MFLLTTDTVKDGESYSLCKKYATLEEAQAALQDAFKNEISKPEGIVFGTTNVDWFVRGDTTYQRWVHSPTSNIIEFRIWQSISLIDCKDPYNLIRLVHADSLAKTSAQA